MTPVTIGDQKFVNDPNKGWIDSKTKQPADKGLIRLLDSMVIDEPVLKKLRVKIDRKVEPVSINGQRFVYDVNQGWIDEKTKVPVPQNMQAILNTTKTVPDVSGAMGIAGKAAIQKTKAKPKPKTGGGTLLYNRDQSINKPLVAMINQLASIDGFLKQRLDNQKIIAKNNLLTTRESQIEAANQEQQVEVIKPDAEKVGGSSAGLVALGGLALLTLDPVQEAIKAIAHGVVETGKFVTGVVSSINKAFTFLFTGKLSADAVPASESGTSPTPAAEPTQGAGTAPSAIPTASATSEQKPGFFSDVAAGAATGAVVGSVVPRVGMVAGAAIGGAYSAVTHFTSGGSTSPATGSAPTTSTTQATPAGNSNAAPQATPAAAGATGEIPKNNIVALGNYLASKGADKGKMENMALSGRVGEHSTNSRHYRGMAIDVNFPTDEAAKLDALAPQLKAAGYNVIWRAKDHYDHMHVSTGGPEGGGSYGDSNSLMGIASQAVENGMEKVAELFGMLGSAIIKPGVPRDKEDYSKSIAAAAIKTNAEVAVTKTPKAAPTPKLPTPPNINKIDGGATQNPATAADKNSVYYYLRRFGFQDLNMPEKALTIV